MIHFLDPGCYCGIEPNRRMLEAGLATLLEPEALELKKPRFNHNVDFDFSVFGEKFDYFFAHSIWTHAPKPQIEMMLDGFRQWSKSNAIFLTSYKPPIPLTIAINPVIELLDDEMVEVNEGCLSVPLRGNVARHVNIRVRYLDRHGGEHDEVKRGLTAGTWQHECDHLDGVLFVDRVTDPTTLATWTEFEAHHRDEFIERITTFVERVGS